MMIIDSIGCIFYEIINDNIIGCIKLKNVFFYFRWNNYLKCDWGVRWILFICD